MTVFLEINLYHADYYHHTDYHHHTDYDCLVRDDEYPHTNYYHHIQRTVERGSRSTVLMKNCILSEDITEQT